jgi:tetratricopeptide (TPR) repeat protein
MYNLGFANLLLEKVKEAKKSFQFLIQHNRDSQDLTRGYYGLTELYYRMGDYEGARDSGQKILGIDPQFSERETILYYLIVISVKEGNTAQITKLAERFLAEYPNSKRLDEIRAPALV